jgi:hypothetical protein
MSVRIEPGSALLTFSYFSFQKSILDEFEISAEKKFGSIYLKAAEYLGSDYTLYYKTEMGTPLYKRILCMAEPFAVKKIYLVKLWALKYEKKLSIQGKRRINIDPGYIQQENFILLTCKRFAQRIHIRNGIYGEITYLFNSQGKPDICLPWTYPDYKNPKIIDYFYKCRKYLKNIK